jgi:hypothetical protein
MSSFAAAGSGRGLIWTVALEGWESAGAVAWAVGAGFRSVVEFEIAALGTGLAGHSDLVEVLVTLGIVGLISWAALWAALFRSGSAPLVLLPVLLFGLANGTLEYVAAFTFGISVAAACAGRGPVARTPPDQRSEATGEPAPALRSANAR